MKKAMMLVSLLAVCAEANALAEHRDRREKTLTCESEDGQYETCYVGSEFVNIEQVSQRSSAACIEGVTYGLAGGQIWVDDGCRAYFRVSTGGRTDEVELVTCESQEQRYQSCRVGRDVNVELNHVLSSATCTEGYSWGFNSNSGSIWVDHGCRAVFEVRRWRSRW
jgi:Protein of unknown function (DUF3011)